MATELAGPGVATFRELWSRRSPGELDQLARVKRFVERYLGDSGFRRALAAADDPAAVGASFGIEVDGAVARALRSGGEGDEGDAVGPVPEAVQLWWEYGEDIRRFAVATRALGDPGAHHPALARWRRRHVRRVDSECGRIGLAIVHPLVAFELSEGCSVGCWFCGVSAGRLGSVWPYSAANARLWREFLEALVELFGPAVGSGFLYWATEPFDNPDYARFLRDFIAVTGRQAQTTTAVPLRDRRLTGEVMALFDEHQHVANRFSVLTRAGLDAVHRAWSPGELLGVELVPQMPGSLLEKAAAGRARQRLGRGGRGFGQGYQQTIACVTGFLVNMVRREVALISPTIAGDRWPDGYKVWGRRGFGSVASFRDAVISLVDDHVAATPQATSPAAFRADLVYCPSGGGFDLVSASQVHAVRGPSLVGAAGAALAAGGDTFGSLRARLVGRGADPLALEAILEDLYDSGLLVEPIDVVPFAEPVPAEAGPSDHGL